MKKTWTILISILLAGCATISTLRPRDTDLAMMQQKVPGINLAEAEKGFKLYKFNCAGCHNLPKPDVYSINREAQIQSNWCWAACVQMVLNYQCGNVRMCELDELL